MIADPEPMTSRANLRWRPTLEVYDGRLPLLRAVDEAKRLRGFRMEAEECSALVGKSSEMFVRPSGMTLQESRGGLDRELTQFLFEQCVDKFQPQIRGLDLDLQFLLPLPGRSYSDRKVSAARGAFGEIAEDLEVNDFAMLFDGVREGGKLIFQAEFGIVSQSEAPARLTQALGRIGTGREEDAFEESTWSPGDLPEVALYVESKWHAHERTPRSHQVEWLLRLLEGYEAHGRELSTLLLRYVTGDDDAAGSN